MTDPDPKAIQALVDAVWAAHDPWQRLARAVHAAWTSPAARAGGGEVDLHAERQPDGTMLRMTAGGHRLEVVLDGAACRDLGRFLTAGGGIGGTR